MKADSVSSQSSGILGKIGIFLMIVGLGILYYDGYRLMQMFPTGYQIHNHPEFHVPMIGMAIAFAGTAIFIRNFLKGGKVL